MKAFLKAKLPLFIPGVLLLSIWEFLVFENARLKFLFASPSLIWQAAVTDLQTWAIWKDCGVTLLEAGLGLLIGTGLGTMSGLMLYSHKGIDRIAQPYITIIGAIPVFALAPVMIVWFGIGLLSKVIMAAFAVYFVSLIQAYEGARETARLHLNFASSLNAPRHKILSKIIAPGSIRWVITGFRMNVGFALFGAFIGEFVSAQAGLGHYILKQSSVYDMPRVFLGLALMSAMALLMTSAVPFARYVRRSKR